MKATVVALLFLMWPGLCSETFAMFSCRDVCELTLLRVDLDETCWVGRHAGFAYFLGVPMLIFYVVGLPALALVGVWRVQKRAADRGAAIETLDGHLVFGLFYSAYDPRVWWWESTVAVRKIGIAAIGVFGSSMGEMQVHITAWLMVVIIALTAIVQPFGQQKILQFLELGTLLATWMTLWAGTVFNTNPRCEDGHGGTLGWCDTLSVLIGVLDIVMVVVAIAVVVYLSKKKMFDGCCGKVQDKTVGKRHREKKVKDAVRRRSRMEASDVTSIANPTVPPAHGGGDSSNKKRRLSSRELMMIEMTDQNDMIVSGTNPMLNSTSAGSNNNSKKKREELVGLEMTNQNDIIMSGTNPMLNSTSAGSSNNSKKKRVATPMGRAKKSKHWTIMKQATNATGAFKQNGKKRAGARLTKDGAPEGGAPDANPTKKLGSARGRWTKIKRVTDGTGKFKHAGKRAGKKRMKRLSEIMKSRQVASADVEIHHDETGRKYSYNRTTQETLWLDEEKKVDEKVDEVADSGSFGTEGEGEIDENSIHVDTTTGHRYSYNKETGEAIWLSDQEEGERQSTTTRRRPSFRKIVDKDSEKVYFENVETGDRVSNVPENGDLVL